MVAEGSDLGDKLAADRTPQLAIVEEGDVLRPWQADHDAQSFGPRGLAQLPARRRVGADRVDAEGGHLREVSCNLGKGGELITVGVRGKRPVGEALAEEAFAAAPERSRREAQELPVGNDAGRRRLRRLAAKLWIGLYGRGDNRAGPLQGSPLWC